MVTTNPVYSTEIQPVFTTCLPCHIRITKLSNKRLNSGRFIEPAGRFRGHECENAGIYLVQFGYIVLLDLKTQIIRLGNTIRDNA